MSLGKEVGLGPGRIVLHGDPAPPHKRGTDLNFRPMFIVAKRLPISATAEHLCCFAFVVLGLDSSVLAKRLARKNVSAMTYSMSSGM